MSIDIFAIKDGSGAVKINLLTDYSQRAEDFSLGSFNIEGNTIREVWEITIPSRAIATIQTRINNLRKALVYEIPYAYQTQTYYWLHLRRTGQTEQRAALISGDIRIIADQTTDASFHGSKQKVQIELVRVKYFEELTYVTRTFNNVSGFGGKFKLDASDMGPDGVRISDMIFDVTLNAGYEVTSLIVGMLDDSTLDTGFIPQWLYTGTLDTDAIGGECHAMAINSGSDTITPEIFNRLLGGTNESHMLGDYYEYIRYTTEWANSVTVTMTGSKNNIAFSEQVDISEDLNGNYRVVNMGRRRIPHSLNTQVDGSTVSNPTTYLTFTVSGDLDAADELYVNGFAFVPAHKSLRVFDPKAPVGSTVTNGDEIGINWQPDYRISAGDVSAISSSKIVRFNDIWNVQGQDLDVTALGARMVLLGETQDASDNQYTHKSLEFDVTVSFYKRSLFIT